MGGGVEMANEESFERIFRNKITTILLERKIMYRELASGVERRHVSPSLLY